MSNNNKISSSMPYPESEEEEELSGSYNINDNGGQLTECSSSNSIGASSSGKTATSTSSNSSDEDDADDATDQDTRTYTDSDDATTTQSDETELAQFSKQHIFRLPRGLCENANIFHEFFSVETWQMLPNDMKARLQPLLPSYASLLAPPQAAAEQQRTLLQLFNGGIQRFGQSPLLRLQRQLEDGSLRPDVLKLRLSIERSQRREWRFQKAERLSRLAKELFLSREQVLQQVYTMAPPSDGDVFKSQPHPRKRKTPTLQRANKFCVERARKRYCQELVQMAREIQLHPGDISADEQDEEAAQLAIIAEERQLKAETTTRPSNAADKKCIYSTFFKRRPGLEDEQVLRSMQSDRIQPLNEKNFKKYLRDYKRRKIEQPQLPDFDTADIRLRDICTRAQFVGNFKPGRKPKALTARLNQQGNEPPALVPIGGKAKLAQPVAELLTDEPQQLYGRAALEPDEEELDRELSEQSDAMHPSASTPGTANAQQLPKLEPIVGRTVFSSSSPRPLVKAGAHITGSPTREHASTGVTQRPNASYFSLIRDLFVSTPQHRLTYQELQTQLNKWRTESSVNGLPEWVRLMPNDWTQLLQSAVGFLSGDFITLPSEYVPYIEHKTHLNIYQWIGAGRDSDSLLHSICQYWLQRRQEDTSASQQQQLSPIATLDMTPTPPPRCPTNWAVRVATQAEMLEFQRQELLRFEQPHRPFTYRMHGYESVVGPVKGIYTQSLAINKARGHAVMVDDRPPYVTILTLVRDATARLPNGEGTRAEISELLKCSQFINRHAAENVLQTIVSGALDRMHGGLDPCVRYDARRKIWIYLHRNRSEADFERMHRQNQTIVKQKQQQRKHNKPKKDEPMVTTQELPALVAASTTTATATTTATTAISSTAVLVKKQPLSTTLPLQIKCPPVPPLKYHIPPTSTSGGGAAGASVASQHIPTQKSLLKSTQRSGVVTLLERSPTAPAAGTVQLLKTSSKTNQQQQQPALNTSPTRNTTPILVSTPSGLQTVHVAATPNKKLAIKKPIVINTPTAHSPVPGTSAATTTTTTTTTTNSPTTGNFIVPVEQQQPQQPNKVLSARQQMPKNIIRLLPAGGSATIGTKPSVVQLPTSPVAARPAAPIQILGPRMLAQTTVRPLQQKIGSVSIVSNKPATTATASPSGTGTGTGTGTIVKMSPQAFASLQQQQLKQKAANAAQQQPQQQQQQQQQQPQQRILVGNTAISSNKNIVLQTLPKAVPKILSTIAGQTKSLATTNLSPQQQRIVLQSFKQPITSGSSTAAAVAGSQSTTRIIRTTPVTAAAATSVGTAAATQGGNILTLENLLQKQNAGKLIQLASTTTTTTTTGGNVISLSTNVQQQQQQQQQQQLTTTKQMPATARIVTAGHSGMVPKIIGKTTVMAGKPLLLHAKTLKLGGNAVVSTQSSTSSTTLTSGGGIMKTAQNIVIGGQTVKLQGTTIPARNASGPMQTVIMGSQLLRLATTGSGNNSINNSVTTSISGSKSSMPSASSGIATAPKTLLIGAGTGQTLRLGKNVLLAASSGSNVCTTSTVATTSTSTPANNLVFAVQNNGTQLFFTPGLQGVNLKPLTNMKVIPMSTASASATAGSGVKISNVSPATVDTVAGKTLNTKLLPIAAVKTASSGLGN